MRKQSFVYAEFHWGKAASPPSSSSYFFLLSPLSACMRASLNGCIALAANMCTNSFLSIGSFVSLFTLFTQQGLQRPRTYNKIGLISYIVLDLYVFLLKKINFNYYINNFEQWNSIGINNYFEFYFRYGILWKGI